MDIFKKQEQTIEETIRSIQALLCRTCERRGTEACETCTKTSNWVPRTDEEATRFVVSRYTGYKKYLTGGLLWTRNIEAAVKFRSHGSALAAAQMVHSPVYETCIEEYHEKSPRR